ncbi:MAG: hypothetical protein JO131_02785 [Gammaproteobacteria bacterium]|nr:hypothetical protein [Gammaproteobacteria bacterium]
MLRTEFDAGEYGWLRPLLSWSDFENCRIDDDSIRYLMTTINENRRNQRFAVYGILDKSDNESPVFYVFFQPSLPSNASDIDMKHF